MNYTDANSPELNREYFQLIQQKKKTTLELQNLDIKETKKTKKILKDIEANIKKIVRECTKKINENLKNGINLKGTLEFIIIKENASLRKKWAKWAKKRGFSFEEQLVNYLNNYASENNLNHYAYRNYTGKFGFQPYDVICFVKNDNPLLFECKASGMEQKNNKMSLNACRRRYANYTESHAARILKMVDTSGAELYFAFKMEKENCVGFVNARLVFANIDYLNNRKLYLKETEYYLLPLDLKISNLDLALELKKLSF